MYLDAVIQLVLVGPQFLGLVGVLNAEYTQKGLFGWFRDVPRRSGGDHVRAASVLLLCSAAGPGGGTWPHTHTHLDRFRHLH